MSLPWFEQEQLDAIRKGYMDKYDGMPPYRDDRIAFGANIAYLEAELVRVRVILNRIKFDCINGLRDNVEKLIEDGLKIKI